MRSALLILLFLPLTVNCQTAFGLKGGLNVADVVMTNFVNPDVEGDLNLKFGMHAGIFLTSEVGDRIGAIGEVLYSNKGVKGLTNIHLHYVALPLLVEYKLGDHFSAELGPEAAYLVSARSAHGDVSSTYNNKFDLSLDAGLRYNTSKVVLGLRYCIGLFSVREPIDAQATVGPDRIRYQNRVVQLWLGYKLKLYQD